MYNILRVMFPLICFYYIVNDFGTHFFNLNKPLETVLLGEACITFFM
jgi:hypothetical protein